MEPERLRAVGLDMRDVEVTTTRGSGPGGQARNKIESCAVATHRPTGITVRIDMRSQHQSRALALKVLAQKVADAHAEQEHADRSGQRRAQVGSGMRGDKMRTYRQQDDRVQDHRTGKSWRLRQWLKGEWD